MSLPSNIPMYDMVPLPDLDHLESTITRPPNPRLRAWHKFSETERRMTLFDWGIWALTKPSGRTLFMNDLASAYLLSFEATLQLLKDECFSGAKPFEAWLRGQAQYDLECRGLRTLRHLEAHVEPLDISTRPGTVADSRFAGPTSGGRTAWFWPPITPAQLAMLRPATPLDLTDLAAWNAQSSQHDVRTLMLHGLEHLRDLLTAAGP